MRMFAIAGSLRRASYNRMVVASLQRLAPPEMEIHVYEGLREIPPYDEDFDTDQAPETVRELRREIRDADVLFIAMPEFNHSIPGVLKNAIDWLTHPLPKAVLTGKVIGIAVVTQGRGGFRGMADLARVLRDLGNFVLPAPEVCIQFAHTRMRAGTGGGVEYTDPTAEALLRLSLRSLRRAAQQNLGAQVAQSLKDTLELMHPPAKAERAGGGT